MFSFHSNHHTSRGMARIIIADDERTSLILMRRLLQASGYTNVVLLQNSCDVIAAYQESPTDLILLDIHMPELSGFDVIEQLRALNDPLLPPILMLTGRRGHGEMLRALESGAHDVIRKPFDQAEVAARVRNMLDVQLAHRMLYDQKDVLERIVQERTMQIRETQLQVVRRLGRAAEYRDNETGQHILRMSHSSALLARHLGWNEERCEMMLHASPMHDVGKIGIPDRILLKPGKLTPEEWRIMQTHASIGGDILSGDTSELLQLAREIALSHHEKWNGSGYPFALAGDAIPESGRIVALADVFDALTSERPYKKAWEIDAALELIKEQAGQHFDPNFVRVFLQLIPEVLAIRQRFSDPIDMGTATMTLPTHY
jgi:putative two-component system response regulator